MCLSRQQNINPSVFCTACRPTPLAGMPVFAYTGRLAVAGALQLRMEGDSRSDSIRGKVQRMQGMRTVCF